MVGVHTTLYKILAFGVSAYFVALGGGVWSYFTSHISPVFAFDIVVGVDMILMTMLGGIGTLWGPVLGAFILVPAGDLILFSLGSNTIYLAIIGALMMTIIIFMPKGILPSIQQKIEDRRAPRAAHQGALSMAEMHGLTENSNSPVEEPHHD